MKIHDVAIESIHVKDRARQEFDRRALDELKASIKEVGLLNPIAVYENRDRTISEAHVLLAGERRLRACKELEMATVTVHILPGDYTKLSAKMVEAAENFYREALTAEERVLLVKEIHEEQVRVYGERIAPHDKDGWSQKDTAKLLGVSAATVSLELQAAKLIEQHPDIATLEGVKKSDLISALKDLKTDAASAKLNVELESRAKESKDIATRNMADRLVVIPSGAALLGLPEAEYDIALVDFRLRPEGVVESEMFEKVFHSLKPNSWLLSIGWDGATAWKTKNFYIRYCFDTIPRTPSVHELAPDIISAYYTAKGNPQLYKPGTKNMFGIFARNEWIGDKNLYLKLLEAFTYPGCKLLVPFVYNGLELLTAAHLGIIPTGYTHDITVRNAFLRHIAEGFDLDSKQDL